MRVTFLGPAYPYRGGIATIIERLARTFQSGWTSESGVQVPPAEVRVLTFRVQYPSWLFPGRTQFRTGSPPADLTIERAINTINPLNWLAIGRRIGRESVLDSARPQPAPPPAPPSSPPSSPPPRLVILKYWTPFMAPCFGVIARSARFFARRYARRHGLDAQPPRFVVQLDNVVPHERHWWDGVLTRFFVGSMDGFVAMSGEVAQQLSEFLPPPAAANRAAQSDPNAAANLTQSAPANRPQSASAGQSKPAPRVVLSPHPLFDHFGERVPRDEACARLGLDPTRKYAMFFGLVREYKGLDLLLEAWSAIRDAAPHLLVVGEFYDAPSRYDLARFGLTANDVTVHPAFVPDEEVGLWFSVADVLVLPYRSATQSGVTQIAYHFDVPMIVTDVGGLPEIVRDDAVGFVVSPTVAGLRSALEKIFFPGTLARLRSNFPAEKRRFSWSSSADALLAAAGFPAD